MVCMLPSKYLDKIEEKVLKHALLNAFLHKGKADVNAVIKKILGEEKELKKNINEIIEIVKKKVNEVNKLSLEEQKKLLEKLEIKLEKRYEDLKLPDLPYTENFILRLAPFPDAPLHIGQARMAILNDYYAKKYNGKLYLVFDDTIGSEEKKVSKDAYSQILEDLKWLKIKIDKIFYKSKRIKKYYKFAKELIEKNIAYVCLCSQEEIRKNRIKGKECIHRSNTIDQNLELWKKMIKGHFKQGEAVLRLKTDMKNKDPAFRDRILCRISERYHPLVGKKYRVWPLLEFSWAFDDIDLNITHIIRGKELRIEDKVEEFIWDKLGFKKPFFIHYGLFTIKDVGKISKSIAKKKIEKGEYFGWEDPRTWSLRSLRKRGIMPQAIRNFIIRMGLSEADIEVPAEILYSENRKLIDYNTKRYFAVLEPFKIKLENLNFKEVEVPFHPENKKLGKRRIKIRKAIFIEKKDFEKYENKEIGLAYLGKFKLSKVSKFISENIEPKINKIQWVSEPLKIKIIMPDSKIIKGICEKGLLKSKIDEVIQFIRIGFCRVEKIKKREIVLYYSHK